MKPTTKENLKLLVMFYMLFNLLMFARGCDEATWTLSAPCKQKVTVMSKFFPGYILGCVFGEEPDEDQFH